MMQNKSNDEYFFKSFEDMIDDNVSMKDDIFLQQIDNKNDDMIIIFNKSSIEISEFNEDLNVQNANRNESEENEIDFC